MTTVSNDLSAFEAISSMIVFVSFLVFGLLVATLRSHIDEDKIRKEESISRVFRSAIPPEHILTVTGKRRVKSAKIALGILSITVAIIVIRNQIFTP